MAGYWLERLVLGRKDRVLAEKAGSHRFLAGYGRVLARKVGFDQVLAGYGRVLAGKVGSWPERPVLVGSCPDMARSWPNMVGSWPERPGLPDSWLDIVGSCPERLVKKAATSKPNSSMSDIDEELGEDEVFFQENNMSNYISTTHGGFTIEDDALDCYDGYEAQIYDLLK
nr:hypothetical protein [Tanacetum cinerariifolium]